MSGDYNYSAFFSYKRGAGADDWHAQSKTQIENYLKHNIGHHDIGMFFDGANIPNGSYWGDELCNGLDRSPILVAFFSIAYFNSDHCVAELETFIDREDHLGLPRGSLIHAAALQPVRHLPAAARAIQMDVFTDYYSLAPAYFDTQQAVDYSNILRDFAARATAKIRIAPAYAADFPKKPPPPPPPIPPAGAGGLPGFSRPAREIPRPFADRISG